MSKVIYLLHAVAFLDLFAVSLIVPIMPDHIRKITGNETYVSLLGSIYDGCQLVSGPLIGSLADIKGRKPVLTMTLMVCSIAYLMLGLTNSVFVILAIRLVLGILKQTQMLTMALVADYEKNKSKQVGIYGQMAAVSGAGMTLGPVIGGHMAEHSFIFIAFIVGFCFATNSCIVYFLPTRMRKKTKRKREKQINLLTRLLTTLQQSLNKLYRIPWSKYWDIFISKALVTFAIGVYHSYYELYLKTYYGLSPKYIDYLLSFQGAISTFFSFFIAYLNGFYIHDTDYSVRNFHVFLLLSIALVGLISSFNILVYTFWLIPLVIGNASSKIVILQMIIERSHRRHTGTLFGASNSVRLMSGVVAPVVSGLIAEHIGIPYVIYASLCSTIIGLMLSVGHIWHRTKSKIE